MPLRRSCFGDDCSERDLFECEHRRWMSTMLMSGYRALTPGEIARVRAEGRVKEEKDRFRHVDIVPYDDLPEEEKDKDISLKVETKEDDTIDITPIKLPKNKKKK